MRLREQGWTPYALRLEPEQDAWVALVMDWAARSLISRSRFRHSRAARTHLPASQRSGMALAFN